MDTRDGLKISELDKLFRLVKEYRESRKFKELLNYIASFKNLSPYNAFLVAQQRPGCKFVLTPDEWKREGRDIRMHARPLVILWPFGPVSFVYDISDTVLSNTKERTLFDSDDDLIEKLSAPFRAYGRVPLRELNLLKRNAKFFGVQTESFVTGSTFAAEIRYLDERDRTTHYRLSIDLGEGKSIDWDSYYLISLRSSAETGEAFASCCHELGHLFCGHLILSPFSITSSGRPLNHAQREFEAESTAWLVCKHFEVDNPSEEYLAGYCKGNEMIPEGVSMERIFSAAKLIIKMASQRMTYSEGWLFKYNKPFKDAVKAIKKIVDAK